MEVDSTVVARLRAAGCVFAEEEAAILSASARTPAELDAMVTRRAAGEPLEQVVGWAEFAGLRVVVDPGVFVPRRRSEFLVSVAVALAGRQNVTMFQDRPAAHHGPVVQDEPVVQDGTVSLEAGVRRAGPRVVADVCCGTGALGLAVAVELSGSDASGRASSEIHLDGVELHAADLDPAAVACARRNVEPAGGHVYQGDLLGALPSGLRGRIGVLICNAPYVPTAEIAFMPSEARDHEAPIALDGGADGLAVLRRVAAEARAWLAPGGVLLVETSERQAPSMKAAMTAGGLAAQIHEDDEYGATVVTGQLG